MNIFKNKKEGFSLIELMVALAIIGVLVALVVSQFATANKQNKINASVKNMAALNAGIAGKFNLKQGYAGITDALLLNTNAVPATMKNGAHITNVWGGNVTVGDFNGTSYGIIYPGVPGIEECIEIVKNLVDGEGNVYVNSTAGTDITMGTSSFNGASSVLTSNSTLAQIDAACNTATATDTVATAIGYEGF